VGYSDAYWAGDPIDRHFIIGYYIFVGSNLVTWRCKKQNIAARSSVEAEYRALTQIAYELIIFFFVSEQSILKSAATLSGIW